MPHNEPSPLAGKTVRLKENVVHLQYPELGGSYFWVEDWWDRVSGGSWMNAEGNPAAIVYALRTGTDNRHVPIDDEVVYGKYGNMGCLIHVCEIEKEMNDGRNESTSEDKRNGTGKAWKEEGNSGVISETG